MFRRKICVLLVCVGVLTFVGCAQRVGDFTAFSTKNVDWARAEDFERHSKRVTGKHTVATSILIVPTFQEPDLKEAMDRAIEEAGGIMLIDAVLYRKSFWIPFIYGQSSYEVEGTPIMDE